MSANAPHPPQALTFTITWQKGPCDLVDCTVTVVDYYSATFADYSMAMVSLSVTTVYCIPKSLHYVVAIVGHSVTTPRQGVTRGRPKRDHGR